MSHHCTQAASSVSKCSVTNVLPYIFAVLFTVFLLFCEVVSSCEEESQGRMCALQRGVAELELKLMKLQQRNERLEHRIEKLRLEKMNLRDTLKQVESGPLTRPQFT